MAFDVRKIGPYRVLGRIGRGGMGEVYRALDERLGREVALKLLPLGLGLAADRRERRELRLLREAQAASALNHPNIVTLFDVGTWADRLYIVMELVDGERLSDLAARGIEPDEALRLVADAADALHVAHERGILHRDIKSDNLMRARDGRLKVVDFGLAKLARKAAQPSSFTPAATGGEATLSEPGDDIEPESFRDLPSPPEETPPPTSQGAITGTDQLVGTPAYMAPEQLEGAPADAGTEVYSLGVVLYELLAGRRPGPSREGEPPRAPSEVTGPGRAANPAADAVALRALDRSRAARFADMAAFASACRAARSRKPWSATRLAWAVPLVLAVPTLLVLVSLRGVGGAKEDRHARAAAVRVDRATRLTFEGGCEEFPSFLPDGHSVLFDAVVREPGAERGDYAVMALDTSTGSQRRLTHGHGRDYAPAVSPDGKRFVYAHRGEDGFEFRVLPVEGDERAVPVGVGPVVGHAAWAPTGELLFGDGAGRILARTATDPVTSVRATLAHGASAQTIAAAPGGALFAVVRQNPTDRAPRLFAIEPGGAEPQALTDASVSTSALVATERSLYYARHEGANNKNELLRRDLATGATEVVPGAPTGSGFDVARDGRRLVYSTCSQWAAPSRLRAAPAELWPRRDWDDFALRRVDDRRLVFTSTRVGAHQVWIVDLRDGKERAIGARGSYGASASPDGERVVFSQPDGLHVADVTGGKSPRRLTEDGTDADAQFSHDGAHVVFLRGGKGGARVHVVPSEGGGEPRVVGDAGVRALAVSPTEARLLVLRVAGGGGVEAALGGMDGGPLVAVSGVPAGDYAAPRFSPDGSRVLLVRRTADVLEVDLAGSRPPEVIFAAGADAIADADYAPDGDGLVGTIVKRSGDLWLLEGEFR